MRPSNVTFFQFLRLLTLRTPSAAPSRPLLASVSRPSHPSGAAAYAAVAAGILPSHLPDADGLIGSRVLLLSREGLATAKGHPLMGIFVEFLNW